MKDLINNIKEFLKASLTSETPVEQVQKIGDLNKDLEDIENKYTKLVEENGKLKNTIIDSVKNGGTKTPPEDSSKGESPKTFEEIANQVVANRKA